MEELLEILMKKYPNYVDLGIKIHEIHNKLKNREKIPHKTWDTIDERLELSKIIREI